MWGDLGCYNDRRMLQTLGMQVRMRMFRTNCLALVSIVSALGNAGPYLKGTAGVVQRAMSTLLADNLGGNLHSDTYLLGCLVLVINLSEP